ncbi:hypothetical protein MH1LPH_19690 [Lactiplantibacillus brownii]
MLNRSLAVFLAALLAGVLAAIYTAFIASRVESMLFNGIAYTLIVYIVISLFRRLIK